MCVAGTMASRSNRAVSGDSSISTISIRNSKPCRRDYRQTSFPTAWRGVSDDTWLDMGEGGAYPMQAQLHMSVGLSSLYCTSWPPSQQQ